MSNVFQGTGNVGEQPCLKTVRVGSEERQVRLALREGQRHGSYAGSVHGFRLQARRNGSPRGAVVLAEVCLSVRLGEALVARLAVLANDAQAMELKPRAMPETRLIKVAHREVDIGELMPRIQHIVHNPFMDTKRPPRHPVTCDYDGETHKASYWVAGKILTVATRRGGNSKQVGTMEPEVLARQLLLELVEAGKG